MSAAFGHLRLTRPLEPAELAALRDRLVFGTIKRLIVSREGDGIETLPNATATVELWDGSRLTWRLATGC